VLTPRTATFTLVSALLLSSCGESPAPVGRDPGDTVAPATADAASAPPRPAPTKRALPRALPKPGNPDGRAPIPAAAEAEDVSRPASVIGDGTPAGCTSDAVVDAVAEGGVITFDCGPAPVTITLTQTARVQNRSARVVLDGGGLVTLSGGGKRRIIHQNTCVSPATSHCQDQDHPALTLQNITLTGGDSSGEDDGGGAVFIRGGRLKLTEIGRASCRERV